MKKIVCFLQFGLLLLGAQGGDIHAQVKTFTNSIGMEFVLIPDGSFMMGMESGRYDESPAHQVTISRPFYLGKYEVTQEQWVAVMGKNPSALSKGRRNPVDNVSWDDVQAFIERLNEKEGGNNKYRLPTEAEWEYAVRAGTISTYFLGEERKFGSFREWVADWYGQYPDDSATDPQGPPTGSDRVLRGSRDGYLQSSARHSASPGVRKYYIGFRLAVSLER